MKKTVLLTALSISYALAFSEDSAAAPADSMVLLMEKVNQLSLEIESLKRENQSNPISSGKYQKWGTGLYVGAEFPYFSAEVGYSLPVFPNGIRLGLAGGYVMKGDFTTLINDRHYWIGNHNAYWKIFASTPVFFNLMSFSASVSEFYEKDKIGIDVDSLRSWHSKGKYPGSVTYLGEVWGDISTTQISAQTEFWLSRRVQFFAGMNTYLNRLQHDKERTDIIRGEGNYDPVETWSVSTFKVGSRFWFGPFSDMGKSHRREKR